MASATPEQIKAMMDGWMAWGERCGAGLIEMGAPLAPATNVSSTGTSASESRVSGYSILEAETKEAALAMLDGHPHLSFDASSGIQLHEAMPM